jgi:hypothetical protein
LAINGKIHLAGGYHPSYYANHDIYDPATNAWTSAAPLPQARSHYGAVVDGTRLYLIGGDLSTGNTNTVIQYDAVADSWAALGPIATSRYHFGVGLIGGKIYVSQGRGPSGILGSTEIYALPKTVYLVEKN